MSAVPGLTGKELYEFGPFRVDAEKELLLRDGETVPLTPKTFQILLVLVRHGQELVSKDDLMKAVWPDTFVEEGNLSRNIFMLRKALGESPQEHRYVLTVPGRGYRLAVDVHKPADQVESNISLVAASRSTVKVRIEEHKSWRWLAWGVVVLLAGAAGALSLNTRRSPVLGEQDTVILADFANSTGDSVFDGTLRQGLAVQLEQSPFLAIISERRVQQTLRLMAKPADAALTPELAREVCERNGSAAVLAGSIAKIGTQYVLGLSAKNCRSDISFADVQAQAQSKEQVLGAMDQAARKLREKLGESLATIQKHDTPLQEATTPSLEALQAYSSAMKVHFSEGAAHSLPLFQRAVELDPQFVMAQAMVGRAYADLDESDQAAESNRTAWKMRERVSDRERFFIVAGYETAVTGNLEAAQTTCQAWAQTYPRDPFPHSLMSGYLYKAVGQFDKAAAEASKAIALDPDFAIGYYNLAVNQAYSEHADEAKSTLSRAAARGLAIDEFGMLDFDLAYLKGDSSGMENVAARARERTAAEAWVSNKEAFALASSGRTREARIATRRAVDNSRQLAQLERAGLWEAGSAVREAFFGNSSEARKRAGAALTLSHDRETQFGAAFALALAGDPVKVQVLADEIERRFPEDTNVRFSYLPAIRALLALNRRNADRALETLQAAEPYELGAHRSSIHGLFGALYPVYVRGLAYLALHDGPRAVGEFQKILAHPGIVVSDPVGPLARLGLARAYLLAGERAKARSAYEDFLDRWKSADSDIPILLQAKNELGRVQ